MTINQVFTPTGLGGDHLANGPLNAERLIRVREWLHSSLAYSGSSNRDYMMADAAKAIDELLTLRKAEQEPVAWIVHARSGDQLTTDGDYVANAEGIGCIHSTPLYAAPQLPQPAVVPGEMSEIDSVEFIVRAAPYSKTEAAQMAWNACRAAMLQDAEPVSQPDTLRDEWVAVPVEPTEGMVIAGFEAELREEFRDPEAWEAFESMSGCEQAAHRAKLCWAAMIAAAPQQERKI